MIISFEFNEILTTLKCVYWVKMNSYLHSDMNSFNATIYELKSMHTNEI